MIIHRRTTWKSLVVPLSVIRAGVALALLLSACNPIQDSASPSLTDSPSLPRVYWLEASGHEFYFARMPRFFVGNDYTVTIKFFDPPAAYRVNCVPWMLMPDGGDHGALPGKEPRLLNALGDEQRVFQFGPLYFHMPGEWQILVQLVDASGRQVDQAIQIVQVY